MFALTTLSSSIPAWFLSIINFRVCLPALQAVPHPFDRVDPPRLFSPVLYFLYIPFSANKVLHPGPGHIHGIRRSSCFFNTDTGNSKTGTFRFWRKKNVPAIVNALPFPNSLRSTGFPGNSQGYLQYGFLSVHFALSCIV